MAVRMSEVVRELQWEVRSVHSSIFRYCETLGTLGDLGDLGTLGTLRNISGGLLAVEV